MASFEDEEINFEYIKEYLGTPTKENNHYAKWQCIYCLDKGKDNLIFDKKANTFGCFSNYSHSKKILSEIYKYHYKNNPSEKEIFRKGTKQKMSNKDDNPKISEEKMQEFKELMYKWNETLLNKPNRLYFLEHNRGVTKDTIKDCFIGYDAERHVYTLPTIKYSTENVIDVIGFEIRPYDFNKKYLHRQKEGTTGMAQINTYNNQPYLAFLEGYMDSYLFYQHLKETNNLHKFHIATPSNGVGTVCTYADAVYYNFHKYKKVFAYLDSDEEGINVMNELKYKYPFIQNIIMECGCKDFNEHYLRCLKNRPTSIKKEMKSEPTQAPTNEVITTEAINTPETILNLVNGNFKQNNINKSYEIVLNGEDFKNKKPKGWLVTDGKEYDIPDCFNIPALLEGNYYVIDSLFKFFSLNTKEYSIKHYEIPMIKDL